MRAIVIGASGFLGRHLMARFAPGDAIGTYHRHPFSGGVPFDGATDDISGLLSPGATHAFVLHATTGTDACARDPIGTAKTNVEGVWLVLRALLDAGIVPVYLSTENVFDGTRGLWRETDTPSPITQYGIQKLEVERRLLADPRPSLVVRVSRVVGSELDTHSVLGPWLQDIRAGKTMRCATDQIFSPVAVEDVAGALIKLAGNGATGLFHLGGPEPYSRVGLLTLLLQSIQRLAPETRADIVPCRLHDLPFLEKPPLDTSISIEKLQSVIGWDFTPMATICSNLAQQHFGANRQRG